MFTHWRRKQHDMASGVVAYSEPPATYRDTLVLDLGVVRRCSWDIPVALIIGSCLSGAPSLRDTDSAIVPRDGSGPVSDYPPN